MFDVENYRIFAFVIIISIVLGLEYFFKQRDHAYSMSRVKSNLGLFILSLILTKAALPFGIYKIIPILNLKSISFIELNQLPFPLGLLLTIIIFDLAIYFQHVMSHKIPFLWRFHLIHHCDDNMDTSTALRFHPAEILLSFLYKIFLITLLKPDPMAYLIYEIILNSMAIFNHANIKIPSSIEKSLRKIIATPAFHTPHHSPNKELTNSNYANFLSLWDYLFKTYKPEINHEFGLKTRFVKDPQSLPELLTASFKK